MSRRRIVTSVARAGTAPVRGYFNRGFESVKDEARRLAAEHRQAAAHDVETVLVAVGRLEEAIGLLGLQVARLRAELDELRAADAAGARDTGGAQDTAGGERTGTAAPAP